MSYRPEDWQGTARRAYTGGYDDGTQDCLKGRTMDVLAIDQLVDFVRTREWSVSMMEDIAEIVQKARPDVFKKDGWSYDADDPRAWRRH